MKLVLLLLVTLLAGCNGSKTDAPILTLSIKNEHGSSTGKYRIFETGLLAAATEATDEGTVLEKFVEVNSIDSTGVTITISIAGSEFGSVSDQVVVPYDEEVQTTISSNVVVKARLDR